METCPVGNPAAQYTEKSSVRLAHKTSKPRNPVNGSGREGSLYLQQQPDHRYQLQDRLHQLQDHRYQLQDRLYRLQDHRYRLPDPRYQRLQDHLYRLQDHLYQLPDPRYQQLQDHRYQQLPNHRNRLPDHWYQLPYHLYQLPDPRYHQLPDHRYQLPDHRYQLPDPRYQQLPDHRYQLPYNLYQLPDHRYQQPEQKNQNPNHQYQGPQGPKLSHPQLSSSNKHAEQDLTQKEEGSSPACTKESPSVTSDPEPSDPLRPPASLSSVSPAPSLLSGCSSVSSSKEDRDDPTTEPVDFVSDILDFPDYCTPELNRMISEGWMEADFTDLVSAFNF